MPRQTTVTLGGQAYQVQARPIGETAVWRNGWRSRSAR